MFRFFRKLGAMGSILAVLLLPFGLLVGTAVVIRSAWRWLAGEKWRWRLRS